MLLFCEANGPIFEKYKITGWDKMSKFRFSGINNHSLWSIWIIKY